MLPLVMESIDEKATDYVFRIVNKSNHREFREFLSKSLMNELRNRLDSVASHPILELGRSSPRRTHLSSCSTNESSDGSSKSMSLDAGGVVQVIHVNNSFLLFSSWCGGI